MLASTSSQAHFFRELRSLLRAPYPLIQLKTYEEDRAVSLLERLANVDERAVRDWSPIVGFGGGKAASPSDAIDHVEAVETSDVIAFRGGHHLFDEPIVRRELRELADHASQAGKSLVFITPLRVEAPELDKELAVISMPLPSREVLARECKDVFPDADYPDIDNQRLVTGALGLTAREANRAFHRVRQQRDEARERNALFDAEQAILSEKKRMIGESEILEYHTLDYGLDDVGGLDILKGWLNERKEAFGEKAREFGLPMPKGLLLIGVQGCGKSLTAKAVARHWGLPLLRLDLGAVFDGRRSPEEALRNGIETSEAIAPCVLWLDEIEKGFAGDAEGRSQRVLGSLLTWQQEKDEPVFMVSTANDVEQLPPELLRKGRFDEIFFIDLPGIHEREEILRIHMTRRGRAFSDDLVEDLAVKTEYFSGAELEQVVVSAMYTAFGDDREVTEEDLMYAVRETVPLYRTYEEQIKALREWAHDRARSASHERELIDFFD